jgi:hypothetical protein
MRRNKNEILRAIIDDYANKRIYLSLRGFADRYNVPLTTLHRWIVKLNAEAAQPENGTQRENGTQPQNGTRSQPDAQSENRTQPLQPDAITSGR